MENRQRSPSVESDRLMTQDDYPQAVAMTFSSFSRGHAFTVNTHPSLASKLLVKRSVSFGLGSFVANCDGPSHPTIKQDQDAPNSDEDSADKSKSPKNISSVGENSTKSLRIGISPEFARENRLSTGFRRTMTLGHRQQQEPVEVLDSEQGASQAVSDPYGILLEMQSLRQRVDELSHANETMAARLEMISQQPRENKMKQDMMSGLTVQLMLSESQDSQSDQNDSVSAGSSHFEHPLNKRNGSVFSFGPKNMKKDSPKKKARRFSEHQKRESDFEPIEIEEELKTPVKVLSGQQKDPNKEATKSSSTTPESNQTGSFEEFTNALANRKVNVFLENLEESKSVNLLKSSNETSDKDFYESYQEKVELELRKELANSLPGVRRAKARKKDVKQQVIQDANIITVSELGDFQKQITTQPLQKPTPLRTTSNPNISKDVNQLESVSEEVSLASSSHFSFKNTPIIDLNRLESFDESNEAKTKSDMSEMINLEDFEMVKQYSLSGIQVNNQQQKDIIDFCIRVGVDPKFYYELQDDMDQQKLAGITRKKYTSKRKSICNLGGDTSPEQRTEQRINQHRSSIKSVKSYQGNNNMQKQKSWKSETRKSSDESVHSNVQIVQQESGTSLANDLKMCHIQILVMAKRLQLYALEDQIRVKKMNQLQEVIRKQQKKVTALDKYHRREKKELHFAFMFACPLALSFNLQDQKQLQMIPQLNHRKEFQIIKQKLAESKAMISITSQQCTIESLQEVLRQKPLGIHFSGHGIQNTFENVGEAHYMFKNEGDFLLLETHEGDSKLVSRQKLQHLISVASCKLEFVVVATCHSEFVGRIFLDAGAQHVVCIRKQDKVMDDAVLHFTNTFYSAVFSQKETICKAFEYAQLSVKLNHNAKESEVFQLLLPKDRDKNTGSPSPIRVLNHICSNFGPFPLGDYQLKEPFVVTFKMSLARMTDLVGRQKDMYNLVSAIMNVNTHLLTLIGLPGVGKSALVKATLQYIQDRNLLRGGLIYIDARSIGFCETFVRNLNAQLISENSLLFGTAKPRNAANQQDSLNTFILIISKVSQQKEDILLVIDNCEDLIENDKSNFKVLLSIILAKAPHITILLTTRVRLGSGLKEANEEIVVLGGLNNLQTEALLKRKINRPITIAEQNQLMKVVPDVSKYPMERGIKPNKLHEHHLFKLLGGNPQSIILIAPLLDDPIRNMQLVDLYTLLTSNQLCQILESEEIEDQMMASLRLSVHVSVKMIEESDPTSMQLFLLLGLLPGGAHYDELDNIWVHLNKLEQRLSKDKQFKRVFTKAINSSESNSSPWKVAKLKLQQNNLIEEIPMESLQERRNTEIRKVMKKKSSSMNLDSDESSSSDSDQMPAFKLSANVKIQMPQYVRNFAEAMITQDEVEAFQLIIAESLIARLEQHYLTNGTVDLSSASKKKLVKDLACLEQNVCAFISRMKDKLCSHDSQWFLQASFSSASKSLKQKSLRNMFNRVKNEDSILDSPKFKTSSTLENLYNSPKRMGSPQKEFSPERASDSAQWVSLYESYNQIQQENKRNNVANEFILYLQLRLGIKPKRREWSQQKWIQLMWQWCLKVYQKKKDLIKQSQMFTRGKTIKLLNDELEENPETVDDQAALKQIESQKKHKFGKDNLPHRNSSSTSLIKAIQSTPRSDILMTSQELAVLYYIANLMFLQRYQIVKNLCEQSLLPMNKANYLFRANIKRYLAVSCLKEAVREQSLQQEDFLRIIKLLEQADAEFKQTNSVWGQALVNFIKGATHIQFQDTNDSEDSSVGFNNQAYDCFMNAFQQFNAIHCHHGSIASGNRLLEMLKSDELSPTNSELRTINEIQAKVKKFRTGVLIIQRSFKQTAYIKRDIDEQTTLFAEVVSNLTEKEFSELNTRMKAIPKKDRCRISQMLTEEQVIPMLMQHHLEQSDERGSLNVIEEQSIRIDNSGSEESSQDY